MRAFKRYSRAGFTLIELMIVVAIIGILAALAIYGVRRYLQSAKTSECKNSIGAISRGAVSAYERESTAQEAPAEGANASQFTHNICGGATAVPGAVPAGRKYQPNTANGSDFETGDAVTGWKCLKFTITSPIYFRYGYSAVPVGGTAAGGTAPAGGIAAATANSFVAWANGDLDGDSQLSGFGQRANINTTTSSVKVDTEIAIVDEFE